MIVLKKINIINTCDPISRRFNVYFSSLKKFDGRKLRKLNLSEIGQIAGRAGRYLNDGNFGITGECDQILLSRDNIDLLEKHKFDEM